LLNISEITTVAPMKLHWSGAEQETSDWKLLSRAPCRRRQTWLLHYIAVTPESRW